MQQTDIYKRDIGIADGSVYIYHVYRFSLNRTKVDSVIQSLLSDFERFFAFIDN